MSTTVATNAPWTLTITIEPAPATVTDIKVGGHSIKDGITHNLPASNAHSTIGEITVVMSDNSQFAGTISIANQGGGQCPFEVTNSGRLPCDLAVGGASVAANAYALQFQTTE